MGNTVVTHITVSHTDPHTLRMCVCVGLFSDCNICVCACELQPYLVPTITMSLARPLIPTTGKTGLVCMLTISGRFNTHTDTSTPEAKTSQQDVHIPHVCPVA